MKISNSVHPTNYLDQKRSRFKSRKEDFEYNFKDVLYMLFWCLKPKPNTKVESESFEERYQKFMKDYSKLNSAIDITNIVSDIRELRVMIEQLKASKIEQTSQKEPKMQQYNSAKDDGNQNILCCILFL